jgi:predicted RNase H-like HicB family nuclease
VPRDNRANPRELLSQLPDRFHFRNQSRLFLGKQRRYLSLKQREGRMYRVWYWPIVDRESDGRFIAGIPDLGDLAAYGENEKDAVAHVTDLAVEHVRALVEGGQAAPRARHASKMPSPARCKEIGRAIIPVEVGRAAARPSPPSNVSD